MGRYANFFTNHDIASSWVHGEVFKIRKNLKIQAPNLKQIPIPNFKISNIRSFHSGAQKATIFCAPAIAQKCQISVLNVLVIEYLNLGFV
jgi:hypothetical protein